jgi:hypothetical protein
VLVSVRRDAAAARRFFRRALATLKVTPNEVVTDAAPDHTAQTIITGHAFIQNLRRGYYELGLDAPRGLRIGAAFTELAAAV